MNSLRLREVSWDNVWRWGEIGLWWCWWENDDAYGTRPMYGDAHGVCDGADGVIEGDTGGGGDVNNDDDVHNGWLLIWWLRLWWYMWYRWCDNDANNGAIAISSLIVVIAATVYARLFPKRCILISKIIFVFVSRNVKTFPLFVSQVTSVESLEEES